MDNGEPEIEVEVDEEGNISANVRLVRTCMDCGTELKEANVEAEAQVSEEFAAKHKGEGHNLSVEATGEDVSETGGGRYKKNVIECTFTARVSCDCNEDATEDLEMKVSESAGYFEEC